MCVSILLLAVTALISSVILFYLLQPSHQPGIIDQDRPYGITIHNRFRKQTIQYMKYLNINWIRYQQKWSELEPQQGHYNWSRLDAAVALANAQKIHITFPLQAAPDWALRQTCAHRKLFPGPDEMASYGQSVAQRYNGKNGHGYIESYEVGNEEFDSLWTGNWQESISCRQPSFYGPLLKATSKAIKKASPRALVGMAAIWWVNTAHVTAYMHWLYQNDYGSSFDYANFHYYVCNGDPTQTKGDRPSLDLEWKIMHKIMQEYGDEHKPIWLTDVGWTTSGVNHDPHCVVTPKTQVLYMLEATQMAMNSHVINHIFWDTVDQDNDGMSLTQPQGKLPAYNALHDFVQKHPCWST
ncbi:hypothetical protein KDA_65580 [Dictyobacter alpinus]|uniref:Glycoside hydrolase family 42 N-terminal domain-containing protein n=1 Tax=Dictyobacter alpinus TaxID=2014873 RepID=A0A402BI45_9CHLR|nr:beta-galactosidase [Dictyobacter alpinus]GCE31074.1 hypothetical protein KDA_65580 [Dictyobacter alpinus]